MHFRRAFFFLVFLAAATWGEDPASAKPAKITNDFIQKEFGASCALVEGFAPMFADMDGDGVEDLVVAAHCTNPMTDQAEHNFAVLDPYYDFFGYGDPKITSSFITDDPKNKGLVVLIIHGRGSEAWYSPKAKFVLINLAFKQVTVKKMMIKKRKAMAIYTVETGAEQNVAAIFWDGKKYKYSPMGSTLE
jgi:hypothetical protein